MSLLVRLLALADQSWGACYQMALEQQKGRATSSPFCLLHRVPAQGGARMYEPEMLAE